jgi:hypothetical protein
VATSKACLATATMPAIVSWTVLRESEVLQMEQQAQLLVAPERGFATSAMKPWALVL